MDGAAELTGARYAGLGMTDPGQDGLVEIRKADLGRAERAGIPVIGVPILVSKEGSRRGGHRGGVRAAVARREARFTGAVEHRVPSPVAAQLLIALRRTLADAVRRPGVTRVEITVDATATLPDGRDAVRLTVYDDGDSRGATTGAGPGTTAIWQAPLGDGTL